MKCFNSMCLTTLLVCGAYCTSNLHAESSEFTKQHDEVIDHDLSEGTSGPENQENEPSRDIPGATGEINGVYINVGENATGNAVEVTTDISISNQSIDNAITTVEITVEQEAPVVEADFDTMVEELVQSGAIQNDISNLEAQPQWKLVLASIASYALSLGMSLQQLLANVFTSLQNTLAGNSTPKKVSKK